MGSCRDSFVTSHTGGRVVQGRTSVTTSAGIFTCGIGVGVLAGDAVALDVFSAALKRATRSAIDPGVVTGVAGGPVAGGVEEDPAPSTGE